MGKLIVVEGIDGTGKETQSRLIVKKLRSMGLDSEYISFPNYDDDSSIAVRHYLNGDYGKRDDLSNYAVHSMYALDRYISYIKYFKEMYENDCILVADRYTISSIIYQSYKFHNIEDIKKFKDYVEDIEYNKFGLPKPDLTIYLDLPPSLSAKLRHERNDTGHEGNDIHESDDVFMNNIYYHSKEVISCLNTGIVVEINCCGEVLSDLDYPYIHSDLTIRPIEDINNDIMSNVELYIL